MKKLDLNTLNPGAGGGIGGMRGAVDEGGRQAGAGWRGAMGRPGMHSGIRTAAGLLLSPWPSALAMPHGRRLPLTQTAQGSSEGARGVSRKAQMGLPRVLTLWLFWLSDSGDAESERYRYIRSKIATFDPSLSQSIRVRSRASGRCVSSAMADLHILHISILFFIFAAS